MRNWRVLTADSIQIRWRSSQCNTLAVSSVLMGASKASQLQDNLGSTNLKLSADELEILDELTRPAAIYPNWFNERIFDSQAKAALER